MAGLHQPLSVPHPRTFAVWLRNARVWRRFAAPSLLGDFGEPFLYLLGLGYGLGRFIGDMADLPYLVYLASGVLCVTAMYAATFEGLYAAFTRMTRQDTYGAMLNTPLQVPDVVAGEVAWCATKSLISGTALLAVAALLGAVPGGAIGVAAALPVVFLIGLTFGALALLITSLAPTYDFFLYYFTVVITPMFLFSGVFYPVETLPDWLRPVVYALPLTHAVDLVRPLVAGQAPGPVWPHLAVLASYTVAAYEAACFFMRRRLLV
jgi:lipooligosaccharide transport system permease protein